MGWVDLTGLLLAADHNHHGNVPRNATALRLLPLTPYKQWYYLQSQSQQQM